eukprot:TRINITY_DN1017_c0_g1_i1.p1 TRINITY_DN1017_c0_g1~~TRINITY_DN1017_c0_g1_i1.p1  ORF type:complete len:930 (+),score=208.51 TRINITY_DN1017_c0_g1_i1:29-2791(+)
MNTSLDFTKSTKIIIFMCLLPCAFAGIMDLVIVNSGFTTVYQTFSSDSNSYTMTVARPQLIQLAARSDNTHIKNVQFSGYQSSTITRDTYTKNDDYYYYGILSSMDCTSKGLQSSSCWLPSSGGSTITVTMSYGCGLFWGFTCTETKTLYLQTSYPLCTTSYPSSSPTITTDTSSTFSSDLDAISFKKTLDFTTPALTDKYSYGLCSSWLYYQYGNSYSEMTSSDLYSASTSSTVALTITEQTNYYRIVRRFNDNSYAYGSYKTVNVCFAKSPNISKKNATVVNVNDSKTYYSLTGNDKSTGNIKVCSNVVWGEECDYAKTRYASLVVQSNVEDTIIEKTIITSTVASTSSTEPSSVCLEFLPNSTYSGNNGYYIKISSKAGGISSSLPKNYIICEAVKPVNLITPPDKSPSVRTSLFYFEWSVQSGGIGYSCSGTEESSLKIYISPKVGSVCTYARQYIGKGSLLNSNYLLGSQYRLERNTTYCWLVMSVAGGTANSSIYEFTTAKTDCRDVTCNHGTCDPLTLVCVCDKDYKGETCNESTKQAYVPVAAIAGPIGGIVLVSLLALLIFYHKKHSDKKISLEKPDLNVVRFAKPEIPPEMNPELEVNQATQFINSEAQKSYLGSTRLANIPKQYDSLCAALVYAFAHEGKALDFIKAMIDAEIATQERQSLFKINSPATRALYYYLRMIGVDYLWESFNGIVLSTMKSSAVKTFDVVVKDSTGSQMASMTSINSISSTTSDGLDEINEMEQGEAALAATRLQVVSERFLHFVMRSKSQLPPEIAIILNHAKEEILENDPDAEVATSLGMVFFIRFILASLTAPESFGVFTGISKEANHQFKMVAKLLQTTLTGQAGNNVYTNCFIEEHFDEISSFLHELCAMGSKATPSEISKVSDELYMRSLKIIQYHMHSHSTQNAN